jgi:hypothetical protein
MADKTRNRCIRRPAVTFALGLFLMVCLGSLMTESADAAPLHGRASGLASCPQLHFGSSGSCVRRLQEKLDKDHVRPYVAVDGQFGKTTKEAVRNFQRSRGLRHDGVAGPRTFRALEGTRPPARPPAPRISGSAWYSGIVRFIENAYRTARRNLGTCLLAFGGMIAVIFVAAAVTDVKSVHLRYSHKGVDCDIQRFPPQRIVNTQADVIRYCADVQSHNPGQSLPAGDYIRSIGQGS